jgi:hypothetical protein
LNHCTLLRGPVESGLEVRIPKPEQKKPKTVQIALGANSDTNTIESADSRTNGRDSVAAN